MTNFWLLIAGVFSALLTAIHVFGGGQDVYHPILAVEMDNLLRGFVSVIWHAVTANLAICSAMLIAAAMSAKNRSLLVGLVIAQYTAFVALFLFYGAYWTGNAFAMMPWLGFAIIVALCALGLWREAKKRDALA